MYWLNILMAAILIGAGLLVKKNPDLIAGYNTLSESEKKKIDIEGFSTFMRNMLILMGLLIIILYPVLTAVSLQIHIIPAIFAIVVLGIFAIYIGMIRYKKR